jgi:hypothetical protein
MSLYVILRLVRYAFVLPVARLVAIEAFPFEFASLGPLCSTSRSRYIRTYLMPRIAAARGSGRQVVPFRSNVA